ncbi:hypothetical protein ZIOFF_039120 [Zingiber officinale]|uniref:Uncharacterized protein n=1 Tax=Zingiber officinale TaxID=94328 RepID=A0A8J5GAS7_ZINOF|nr:hypothetical protein ZIOFF_039120 [Zingiber officinale]
MRVGFEGDEAKIENNGAAKLRFHWIILRKNKIKEASLWCPKILTLSLNQKLVPSFQCLATFGSKPGEVASAITKFPGILSHRFEQKLSSASFLPSFRHFREATGVEKRLWPTTEFLKDVDRVLRPNLAFLKWCGFHNKQIANLVAGYPPALIKSVSKSLEPKMRFLVEEMGRDISEIANYLEFFRHGKNKSLEAKSFEATKYTMQFK